MSIVWLPSAIHDARELRAHIGRRDPGLAAVMMARIRRAVEVLDQFPRYGRAGRREGTRELVVPRTSYVVIYQLVEDGVELLRVLHGAQDWPTSH